jgi:hypothetical protein
MPYSPRDVEGMLRIKLNMVIENADHKWFKLELNGLPPIHTKLPNHREDIRDQLESKIHKQLRIRKMFFRGLMDCTKNRADYEEQIRRDPYPPFDILIV